MANTVINTPELLNLDSTTGATILAKGTISERPPTPTFGVDYLVVAGGGGGAGDIGGGGGAGGLRTSYGSTTGGGGSAEATLLLPIATDYTVTVGSGGAGVGSNTNGNNGSNSVFSTITSTGGGGGSIYNTDGSSGGSGGGGGRRTGNGGSAITSPIVQGYNGGNGTYYTSDGSGGGGGGAGGVGQSLSGPSGGGSSLSVSITGAPVDYAGGGGGGSGQGGGNATGGGAGAGTGGASGGGGSSASVNTGSGGGGGANAGGAGGAGGSGIVILRYPNTFTLVVGSGSLTTGQLNTAVGTDEKYTSFTGGTGTISFSGTAVGGDNDATDGTLRFNTETNKTEYYDGTGWYEIVDEYASGFIGPATNYFDTKLYTGNGATQSIGGYINGSASFNGGSSFISIDNSTVFDLTTYSVSFWIYSSDYNQSTTTVYNGGLDVSGGSWGGLAFGVNSNKVYYYGGDVAGAGGSGFFTQTGATNLTNGQWINVVMIVNGTSITGYINGTQDTGLSRTLGANIVYRGQHKNTIGVRTGSFGSYGYFSGAIDQFRFYNTALSSSDVAALSNETATTATTAAYPSGQTAIATYTMDTSANGLLNTQDLSTVNYPAGAGCLALYEMNGNSNDTSGTYNGVPTNITYQGGAFDQAAVFNGSSSYIDINNITGISGTSSQVSISAWFNFSGTSGDRFIISLRDGCLSEIGFNSGYSPRKLEFKIFDGGNKTVLVDESSITYNKWHHIVLTAESGGLLTAYLDGVSQGTTSIGTISNTTQNNSIGAYNISGTPFGYFDGSIDQVRIFDTALTQAQVTTLARGIATSYSGAATNVNFNGHLDFAPDFVWIKSRTFNDNHNIADTVRGATKYIFPNLNSNEFTSSAYLNRFSANGFSIGSDNSGNKIGENFVSWNWKAGGAAVTNNNGTIAGQVSANKDSGFSIVKYTGTSTSGATIGHGLDNPPEMVILKNLDSSANWYIYHKDTGTTSGYINYLKFDATTGSYSDKIFYPVNFNSSTLTPGYDSVLQGNMIAYCFHSVAGYSKMGTYTGNGSSTGPNVTLGFTPSFLMVKRTDSGDNWLVFDNKRNTTNPTNLALVPNSLAAESVGNLGNGFNFLSNGFQVVSTDTGINANGGEYIYMAFA